MNTNQDWRYSAKSVTKYNPLFRDDHGNYKREEWIGFFQVGKQINGELLTFADYEETEKKYLLAAKMFFQFHDCKRITIKNLEKKTLSTYTQEDKLSLSKLFKSVKNGSKLSLDEAEEVIKLILRELVWAELFCGEDNSTAIRFGYDFYMYFNSEKNWDALNENITNLGLFVW